MQAGLPEERGRGIPGAGWLRWGLGLVALGALLAVLDAEQAVAYATRIDPIWIALAAGGLVTTTLLGCFNVHLLLDRTRAVGLPAFLPIFWVAWATGLVVPGQVGDVASISLMLRRRGVDWHTSLGRTLTDKVITLLVNSSLALAGLLWVVGPAYRVAPPRGWWLVLLTAAILAGFALRGGLSRWFRPERPGLLGLVGRTAGEMAETVRRHPGRVALNLSLSVVKTAIAGLPFWFLLTGMGFEGLGIPEVVMLVSAASLVGYVPVSVNGLGTVEAVAVALFASLDVPAEAVLATYLMLRVLVLAMAWIPAGLWLLAARPPSPGSSP